MKFFAICLLATAFCVCQGFLLDNTHAACTSDADCPVTHCCATDRLRGKSCHAYQNSSDPCHLPGHDYHLYHCNCNQGLTCQPIVIDPQHTNPDLVHAEQILQQTGFGLCS